VRKVGRRGENRENENEDDGGASEHLGFLREVFLRPEGYMDNGIGDRSTGEPFQS